MAAIDNSLTLVPLNFDQWLKPAQEAMPHFSQAALLNIYTYATQNREKYAEIAKQKGTPLLTRNKTIGRRIIFCEDGSFFVLTQEPTTDAPFGKGGYKQFWKAIDQSGLYRAFGLAYKDLHFEQALKIEIENLNLVKESDYFVKILHSLEVTYQINPTTLYSTPAILIEYCNLGDLFQFFKNPEYLRDSHWKKNLFQDLLFGANWMHERGYIHRDLKPPNILCSNQEGIIHFKIADLSSMCRFDRPDENRKTLFQRITTSWYASPELASAITIYPQDQSVSLVLKNIAPVNPLLDMWGIGCCLINALTLKRLPWCYSQTDYQPTIEVQKLSKTEFVITPTPSTESPFHIIGRLLQPNPEKRASAQQCIEEFPLINWEQPCENPAVEWAIVADNVVVLEESDEKQKM